MKKIALVMTICIASISALYLIAGITANPVFKWERNYQARADRIRVRDVHTIAELVEVFHSKTGHYPLTKGKRTLPLEVPLTYRENYLDQLRKAGKNYATIEEFIDEIGPAVGDIVVMRNHKVLKTKTFDSSNRKARRSDPFARILPIDPQRAAYKAARLYSYWTDGKDYIVSAYLFSPTPFTKALGEDSHKYEVSSKEDIENKIYKYSKIKENLDWVAGDLKPKASIDAKLIETPEIYVYFDSRTGELALRMYALQARAGEDRARELFETIDDLVRRNLFAKSAFGLDDFNSTYESLFRHGGGLAVEILMETKKWNRPDLLATVFEAVLGVKCIISRDWEAQGIKLIIDTDKVEVRHHNAKNVYARVIHKSGINSDSPTPESEKGEVSISELRDRGAPGNTAILWPSSETAFDVVIGPPANPETSSPTPLLPFYDAKYGDRKYTQKLHRL